MSILLGLTLGALQPGAAAPLPQHSLVGSWRLERYVDEPDGGAPVHTFGERPIGLFLFTPDGHAAIHIMRNPPTARPVEADPDPDACVPAWYCSYFGTYMLDPAGGRWIIHVEGGNIPSFFGTDQTRAFRIEGDRLIISGSYEQNGRAVRYERVLVRTR